MRHKSIDAFVRYSVKADDDCPDEDALQELLDKMSTDELQRFWFHFAASRSLSKASMAVPDWQTRRQKAYLLNELASYAFHPTETGANGKYIRAEIQGHITAHLIKHIADERQLRHNERELRRLLKSRPLRQKMHDCIRIFIAFPILPLIVCFFLPDT